MCGTQEPTLISKIWVPVGSGFQAVGSGGFRVPTKFCFVPTPDQDKSGCVDFQEFAALMAALASATKEMLE